MATQDQLTLRTVRLKPLEEWSIDGQGLAFVLAKAGRASFMLGPAAQQVGPRDVLVLDRVCGGRLAAREGGEFYFGNFVLNPEQLFPLLDGAEISFLQKVTEVFKGARVYPAQSESARECHRLAEGVTAQYDLGHRSQLLRVGAVILSAEFKQARRHASGYVRIEEHMMQVFEQLSTGEILNSSVSELAEKFGCSRRHLNRLFHQHFGISVAALKMEMRLLKAVSLLRNPDAKVIHVAEECGFNHLGLFNTCFKRRFGTSPGLWRKPNEPVGGRLDGSPIGSLGCPLRVTGLCPNVGGPDTTGPTLLRGPQRQMDRPTAGGRAAEGRGKPFAANGAKTLASDDPCTRD
ncbi:MAG: helix-turn-helix domain-containing protein [Limisphaerales bacterium]